MFNIHLFITGILILLTGAVTHAQYSKVEIPQEFVGLEEIAVLEEEAIPDPKMPEKPLSSKVVSAITNSVTNVKTELQKESQGAKTKREREQLWNEQAQRVMSFYNEQKPIRNFRAKFGPACKRPEKRAAMSQEDFKEIRSYLWSQNERLHAVVHSLQNVEINVQKKIHDLRAKENDPYLKSEVFQARPETIDIQIAGDTKPLDPLALAALKAQMDITWTRSLIERYYNDMTGEGTYLFDPRLSAFCFDVSIEYKGSWKPVDVADCSDEQKIRLRQGFAFRVPWRFIAITAGETQIVRFAIVRPVIAAGKAIQAGLAVKGVASGALSVASKDRVVTTILKLNGGMLPTPCYTPATMWVCMKGLGLVSGTETLAMAGIKLVKFLVPTAALSDLVRNRIFPWMNYIYNNYYKAGRVLGEAHDQIANFYEQALDYCYYRSCFQKSIEEQSRSSQPHLKDYAQSLKTDSSMLYCSQEVPRMLTAVRDSQYSSAIGVRIAEAISRILPWPLKNTMTELLVRLDEINSGNLSKWTLDNITFKATPQGAR